MKLKLNAKRKSVVNLLLIVHRVLYRTIFFGLIIATRTKLLRKSLRKSYYKLPQLTFTRQEVRLHPLMTFMRGFQMDTTIRTIF